MEEIRNFFESDNEENMNIENDENNEDIEMENVSNNEESIESEINEPFKYNEGDFEKDKIFKFLCDNNILLQNPICEKCNKIMKLSKNKKRIDGKIWRCTKKGANKHDNKINIRAGSIFENIKADIRILYFLLFYNFVENKSINESYNNSIEFYKQLKLEFITKKLVSKFYLQIRKKIMIKMHKNWENNPLGVEPCINGKSYCEIDESKIINYENQTRWMFGIYDRGTKDVRIFFVDNNRTKETLLPIVKANIYSVYQHLDSNEDPNHDSYPTRIFSDCFQTYQVGDFNQLGFILHKVNHSIWFGQGHFHTNSIEGTWSKLKRLTKSFTGLNGNIFNTKKNIEDKEYFDGWICTGIFFMKYESLNLSYNAKKNYLISFLTLS